MTEHDDDIRAAARANIKARNDFHVILTIFGVIALLLIAIWFFSTGPASYFWPVWPILGMFVAAVFVGLDAYGITRRRITEADIDAEVERMTAGRSAKSAPAPAPASAPAPAPAAVVTPVAEEPVVAPKATASKSPAPKSPAAKSAAPATTTPKPRTAKPKAD